MVNQNIDHSPWSIFLDIKEREREREIDFLCLKATALQEDRTMLLNRREVVSN